MFSDFFYVILWCYIIYKTLGANTRILQNICLNVGFYETFETTYKMLRIIYYFLYFEKSRENFIKKNYTS